jgi:metal-responsive CopG/Arc/MetJ family transcriptional regulator
MNPAISSVPTQATRRSISVPNEVYEKVDEIATNRHISINRAIVDLLTDAIQAYERRRQSFLELADRYRRATDQNEIEKLRDQLAEMTFGG